MKRSWIIVKICMVTGWLLGADAIPVLGQSTGTIAGVTIIAGSNIPLADVNVVLADIERGAVTGADGRFEITGLEPGSYTVKASYIGFETASRSVDVLSGNTTHLFLALKPTAADLEEVVVEGRAANLVGAAESASQGRVSQAQLAPRPLLRIGEVLETVPGTIVTQHSGSGKANQFFLRGFNLDHGTDFSSFVEGVPMNLPTHAHGQGYLDLNFLIPELIERISYEKGPFYPEGSDFATAGSARIKLAQRLETGIARATAGTDEHYEAVLAQSSPIGSGDFLYGLRTRYYNGPWETPEEGTLLSGVMKYSGGSAADGYSVTFLGYRNGWNATDQIPTRAVEVGRLSRFGSLDPSDGGRTSRYTLAGSWWSAPADRGRTHASAYAAYYHLNLFSNFTYLLDNSVQGDQFEQADRRVYGGGTLTHQRLTAPFGLAGMTTVGAQFRHDHILQVALFQTEARTRIGTVRDDDVAVSSLGAFVKNETHWFGKVRTVIGLRGDAYRFDVRSDVSENSGTEVDLIVSPKLGLAFGPFSGTEFYLNLGTGYHSNDARGTTITLDPLTGEPAERVDPLVRTVGAEVGARVAELRGLQTTFAFWFIGSESELVFVGDAGGTEASRASEHYGVEWNNYYAVTEWLNLNLDLAFTESFYTQDDPEGNEIENSIGRTITGGVYLELPTGWLASVQVRHFGPRPLTPDGSVESESTSLVNLKAGYQFKRAIISLDVLNVADSEDDDVSYFYPSRLADEPASGVADVHFHPVIPRTARLSLVWKF